MKTALILVLLLTGCQAVQRVRANRLAAAEAALAPEAAIELGEIETGRRLTSDADIYQPAFRLLEDYRGRLRLIVQDPETHRYRVVN